MLLCFGVSTRLFSLKYSIFPVWGPEIVDKATLHAEQAVDRASKPFPFHPPFQYLSYS